MSQRIQDLIKQATIRVNNPIVNSDGKVICDDWEQGVSLSKFAELIVEATLTQVAERAYYSGDRAWSDELDRPWVQLEFGLGPLADAQRKAGIK